MNDCQRANSSADLLSENDERGASTHLALLSSGLVESGGSVAAFALTGAEEQLALYSADGPKIDAEYQQALKGVSEQQRQAMRTLKPLIDQKMQTSSAIVDARRVGFNQTLLSGLISRSEAQMAAIAAVLSSQLVAADSERSDLVSQGLHDIRVVWVTGLVAVCGALLTLLVGVLGIHNFNTRTLRERNGMFSKLLQEAQRATRFGSDFLGNISHEVSRSNERRRRRHRPHAAARCVPTHALAHSFCLLPAVRCSLRSAPR